MALTIKTNNARRFLACYAELATKEQADFDYMLSESNKDELYTPRFFRYVGNVYDTNEFERIAINTPTEPLRKWDAAQSESFFSGVVFKWDTTYDKEYGTIIVGRYSE